MASLRLGSGVLLVLCFLSWVIALGGLGSINWLVCSNYDKTSKDIVANYKKNYPNAAVATNSIAQMSTLNIPTSKEDTALCARTWRWEWFCMFFEFAVIASALAVTCLPRLVRARFPLANLLSIATVIIMIAVNQNITDVWFFWDSHEMFSEWTGVLKQLYLSAAALVAGWILVIFFNLIWIAFVGDHDATAAEDDKKKPVLSGQA